MEFGQKVGYGLSKILYDCLKINWGCLVGPKVEPYRDAFIVWLFVCYLSLLMGDVPLVLGKFMFRHTESVCGLKNVNTYDEVYCHAWVQLLLDKIL